MPRTVAAVVAPGGLGGRPQPVLDAGAGIVLRPWTDDDAAAVVEAFDDPAIRFWHFRSMASLAEARRWVTLWQVAWQAETDAAFAVVDRDGLAGSVALRDVLLAGGLAQVSYWTLPRARGRGVAAAAADRLARFAFDDVGLVRLELMHSTVNAASCRVAAKAGFVPEGVARQALRHEDGWHDMHRHARLWSDEVG